MRLFVCLVAATAIIGLGDPAAAQSVAAGIEAWKNGDPATAVAIWKPLADKGDADAAFNLGQAYRLGKGVKLDLSEAQDWLERAARNDHVDAQVTLGLLLFDNGNRTAGLRWLKSAAEKGEPRAMLVFGTALFNGDGVPSDPVLAYAYVSRAAAQGLAPAKSTLAQMDSVLSLDERQKGVALAMQKAKSAGEKSKPAPAKPEPAKPEPAKSEPAKSAAAKPETPKPQTAKAEPVKAPARQEAKAATTAKPAPPAASGRWRIQLGAFSKKDSAATLYKRLASSAPVAGHQSYLIPVGAMTRLQVGPFESRAAATSACAALKAKGQACFPVGPN